MHTAPLLHDYQRLLLAALHGEGDAGLAALIAANGLTPGSRLRIYRHSSEEIHLAALRTTYPATLALAGGTFFEQAALDYRRAHPSRSGNLQEFGAVFAEYLGSLPQAHTVPYLPDVARLEWLRQEVALAADAEPLSQAAIGDSPMAAGITARITLHPSVRLLTSRHAVLTIWGYAMHPSNERLALPPYGENVVLWRQDGEVAMAKMDAARARCMQALAQGVILEAANCVAGAADPEFDSQAFLASLAENGLVTGVMAAKQGGTRCSSG